MRVLRLCTLNFFCIKLSDEEKGENRKRGNSIPREDGQEEMDLKQPTIWLGTEDGW